MPFKGMGVIGGGKGANGRHLRPWALGRGGQHDQKTKICFPTYLCVGVFRFREGKPKEETTNHTSCGGMAPKRPRETLPVDRL